MQPMQRTHAKHSEQIVAQFQQELGAELSSSISDYYWGTLAVMIEAALSSAVMNSMKSTMEDVEALLAVVRKRAGR